MECSCAKLGLQLVPAQAGRAAVLAPVRSLSAGWALLALGCVALAAALLRGGGRSRDQAGTWVRDRSLGGRLVRVAQPSPGAPRRGNWRGSSGRGGANPLAEEKEAAKRPAKAAAPLRAAAPPAWWLSWEAPLLPPSPLKQAAGWAAAKQGHGSA